MELGSILLTIGFLILIFILLISRNLGNRRANIIWAHQKNSPRIRTVGPCAVAVGVYKTYEDRARLDKMYSEFKLKDKNPE
jgi:hypothetical protein